ncbi:metallophosphoesterase [Chloroflexus sp.]|uniref:metallophosphoesterase n=1 Tax=Chloroflexus sp. TaxID=1904827 RepID=UPI002630802D|nr:metallophosphoesterase [uncultured Chloroflexus sp.]
MATTIPSSQTTTKRQPRLRYSPRWIGAGLAGSILVGLASVYGGPVVVAALAGAGAVGAGYALAVEPRRLHLQAYTLHVANLPEGLNGLTIGQLSDLHLGHRYSFVNAQRAIDHLLAAQPDLIALTGDLVQTRSAIARLPEVLKRLHAPLGVYAVPGNHDYWEGMPHIAAILREHGIHLLINRHRLIERNGARLLIAGVDDHWDGQPDLNLALGGAPAHDFRLLLAHCPDIADEAAAAGFQLQLSGHTHGGHVRMPGLGPLCLPRHGWRYDMGHFRVGAMHLFVSRGAGGLPLRLGCPPEVSLLRLRGGDG